MCYVSYRIGSNRIGRDPNAKLSAVMKPETNLAAIYDDATELEQVFIKKLALFFTGETDRPQAHKQANKQNTRTLQTACSLCCGEGDERHSLYIGRGEKERRMGCFAKGANHSLPVRRAKRRER